jgi:signal recognition particle receptor subunit beta
MKSYLLFIYGVFDDEKDIEFFCLEILGQSPFVSSVRYIIENNQNIIVMFDSNEDNEVLSNEIHLLSKNDSVKFYFLIEKPSLVSVYLPETINDYIFKPSTSDPLMIKVEYEKNTEVQRADLNLDDVLDKIDYYGIESLTPEEKKFLDNFEK